MKVTLEDVRRAITEKVEELKQAFDYPISVSYDNHDTANYELQSKPYVDVSIMWQGGQQMGLSMIQPGHRMQGSIIVEVRAKEGSGMREANTILEHFYPSLQMTNGMYPVRTYAGRPASRPAANGWAGVAMVIPFWVDSFGCC